ncbi:hypothetical protein ACQ4PT_040335 [Festuca glaucescens]
MEHQPPADDVVVQVSAAAVAAIDERSSTNDEDDAGAGDVCRARRTFSHSYKMEHRKPLDFTWLQIGVLSYQSLGIVYGDLGTSPLYVFSSVKLPNPGEDDFLGILSLILWTLTLIGLIKYTFIVLRADDHGEGGTFALYSLLRQHVNFKGSMPMPVTRLASDINLKFHSKKCKLPSKMRDFLEKSTLAQAVITYMVLCATSMVMGDGALTPAISVLSAVQGIQTRSDRITQGTVVIFVMLFTTALMSVNMVIVWQWHILLVALCFGVFFSIEGIYMTSLLYKVLQGGWVPFVITAFFLSITTSWTYGRRKKNEYEAANLVDRQEFLKIVTMSSKVPGICIFCTDLMNGIPPIVRHYVRHTGSIREVTVFVTVRILPVTFVLPEERFLVDKLDHVGVYRCILQYGYMDKHNIDDDDFVVLVVASLKEIADNNDETLLLDSAFTNGTTFVFGRTILKMGTGRNRFKRFVINNLYRFLQKNFRSNMSSLKIAPGKTLQVGMHYEI